MNSLFRVPTLAKKYFKTLLSFFEIFRDLLSGALRITVVLHSWHRQRERCTATWVPYTQHDLLRWWISLHQEREGGSVEELWAESAFIPHSGRIADVSLHRRVNSNAWFKSKCRKRWSTWSLNSDSSPVLSHFSLTCDLSWAARWWLALGTITIVVITQC